MRETFCLLPETRELLSQARVVGLFRYPVKSCHREELQVAELDLDEEGIVGDRLVMLVDENNVFMTQRKHPRMTLIKPIYTGESLELTAPGMRPLEVRLTSEREPFEAQIWDDRVLVVSQGEEAAGWFSDFLGVQCQLVGKAPGFQREANSKFTRGRHGLAAFQDAMPFHILSEETVAEFNRRAVRNGSEPVPINRFRPNVVLSGSGIPHTEDLMAEFSIGDVPFKGGGYCYRCPITITDQETGEIGSEPLRTLATYRAQLRSDGTPVRLLFGRYFMYREREGGVLRIGDRIQVFKTDLPPVVTDSRSYNILKKEGFPPGELWPFVPDDLSPATVPSKY